MNTDMALRLRNMGEVDPHCIRRQSFAYPVRPLDKKDVLFIRKDFRKAQRQEFFGIFKAIAIHMIRAGELRMRNGILFHNNERRTRYGFLDT